METEVIIHKPLRHIDILAKLLDKVRPIDFRELIGEEDEKIKTRHLLILTVEEILRLAADNNWGMCQRNACIYLYNGTFWSKVFDEEMEIFLGKASEKMGINSFTARHYPFRDMLLKEFRTLAHLPSATQPDNAVMINLQNGTYEINGMGGYLRQFAAEDFLTYQLPFAYNDQAEAPIFKRYLDRVLPDATLQGILSEFLGYVFIQTGTLKLEKALILYGTGANGKSVFFDVISALLGSGNVSSYSLQSLTNESGYYRAMLADKLLNYASEINGSLEASIFKQLVSGEPVEARLPYKDPFMLTNYAKLIFNCNSLPRDVEHTQAYFRRFLIIPFNVTIPEEEQDPELAQKIIASELAGVFNWVLAGLGRVLKQRGFTHSDVIRQQVDEYQRTSDSVGMFLYDNDYVRSTKNQRTMLLKDLYAEYKGYCLEDGFRALSKVNFQQRLKYLRYVIDKDKYGNKVYIEKEQENHTEPLPVNGYSNIDNANSDDQLPF